MFAAIRKANGFIQWMMAFRCRTPNSKWFGQFIAIYGLGTKGYFIPIENWIVTDAIVAE